MLNTWQNHTLAVNHQLLDIFTQSIISRLTFTHLANAKVFRSFVCSNAKGWKISSNFPKFSKNFHHFAKVSKNKILESKKKNNKIHPLQTCMLGYQTHDVYLLYQLSYKNKTASESLTCSESQGLYIACLFLFWSSSSVVVSWFQRHRCQQQKTYVRVKSLE